MVRPSRGCLFDADEYLYIEDPDQVPADLRPLFDLVWDDLEGEVDDQEDDGPGGFQVALAMAEQVTGINISVEQVAEIQARQFFAAPTMRYVEE